MDSTQKPSWTIEQHGNGYALYSGRGPIMHGMNLVHLSEPDHNWEQTKRLIESVPELVRACMMLVDWADWPGDAPEMLDEAVEAARAALRKSFNSEQ